MKAIKILAVSLSTLLAGTAIQAAENVAIIIANKNYTSLRDVREAFTAFTASKSLEDAGFDVLTFRDLDQQDLAAGASDIERAVTDAERVVVFLAGHVGSIDHDSWLLTTDARHPSGLTAGMNGLSVNGLMHLLADKAGSAVVLVGRHPTTQLLGPGLDYGYVPGEIPQGVTVYSGPTIDLLDVLRQDLLKDGMTTRDIAEAAPNSVSAHGFISGTVAFLPETVAVAEAPAGDSEALVWNQARLSGTAAAIESYLDRYPEGQFALAAREMLAELQKTPEDLAREGEEALALSRDARREIQRNLSLLGFDTRGVDGIFGRGSRAAIGAWQKANGFASNGYVSGNQIAALQAAAAVRSRELEEEARIRREEEERLDAAFWRDNVRGNGEAGMRAYLKRYPDGLYSDIARERLEVFDEERRRTAAIAEGNAWDVAAAAGTIEGYEAFLSEYPDGAFAVSAQEKLAALKAAEASSGAAASAQAEEQQVMANPITRLLVEQRLTQLGFKPGRIDGKIDADTRKALRRFQKAAGLTVTGFVSQETVVRLLAAQGG